MADLRTRFASFDSQPVPDLWAEIERRAAAGAPAPTTEVGAARRLRDARPTWRGAAPSERTSGRRLVLVLVLLGLLVVGGGLAIAIGSGLVRLPWQSTPAPTDALSPDAGFALQPTHIEDFSAEFSLPSGWQEVDPQCCEFRQFAGTEPEGHLTIGH